MDILSIPILATAISIIICWALFAIFCSFVHEAIATIKAERGRYLKKWLFKQLYDHPNGVNWASMIYMHGTVDLLTRTSGEPTSHITPKLFAETLIEVAGKAHLVQMYKQGFEEAAGSTSLLVYRSEVLNNFKAATLVLKPSDVVSFMQQSMSSAEMRTRADGSADESAIYQCLVAQIESWYGVMMDRLGEWYKKRTRLRLFIAGVLIALFANVDSVQLFSHFANNPASRVALMQYHEANAERLEQLAGRTGDSATLGSLQTDASSFQAEMDSLIRKQQLPVGYQYNVFSSAGSGSRYWTLKILGILLSGFAASFGAPFWYDFLKKIYSRKPQNNS